MVRTLRAQPLGELVAMAAHGRVERSEPIVADPVDVGATLEQELGRRSSATMARTPERVGDLVPPGRRLVLDESLEAVSETERGRLPHVRAGAELHEPRSRAPLA